MHFKRLSLSEACKYLGQRLQGRVGSYSIKEGYGFLHTEIGKDILLSSYELKNLENKIALGTVLSFGISISRDRVMASNVLIEDNSHFNDVIIMENGVSFKLKKLETIDLRPGERILQIIGDKEKEHILSHHDVSILNHIYIRENNGKEHRYFGKGCPYSKRSGIISDIEGFYKEIDDKYFKI